MANFNAELAVRPVYETVQTIATLHTGIPPTRAIYVATDGTYYLHFAGDATGANVIGLVGGVLYPFSVIQISAAGGAGAIATLGDVVACY